MRDGYQATTIAAIAEAADVALRTVSLHFPTKADLLFPGDAVFDAFAERLHDRPTGETALDALRGWLAAELRERDRADTADRDRDWERARARRAIIDADPVLRQAERGHLERFERLVTAEVARDTGETPDDLLPQMTGAAAVAVLTMLERTRAARSQPMTSDQALALIDRVLTFLRGGIAATRS